MPRIATFTQKAPRPTRLRRRVLKLKPRAVTGMQDIIRKAYSTNSEPDGFPIKIERARLQEMAMRRRFGSIFMFHVISFDNGHLMVFGDDSDVMLASPLPDGRHRLHPWLFEMTSAAELRLGGGRAVFHRNYYRSTCQVRLCLKHDYDHKEGSPIDDGKDSVLPGITADLKARLLDAIGDEVAQWCKALKIAEADLKEGEVWPAALCDAGIDHDIADRLRPLLSLASRAAVHKSQGKIQKAMCVTAPCSPAQVPGLRGTRSHYWFSPNSLPQSVQDEADKIREAILSHPSARDLLGSLPAMRMPTPPAYGAYRRYSFPERTKYSISQDRTEPLTAHEQIEIEALLSKTG